MFHGSIPAIITPFRNGQVDWETLEALLEWQIAQGSHGVVLCGTTGESPTLTHNEHKLIVERGVQMVKGRIPVIAGTGSNSTAEALDFTLEAEKAGADGALIVTPYYNKPTQEGLIAHYGVLAKATKLPIIIYNIPGRCVIDMKIETMTTIAKSHKNIIGVKDATADITRVKKTIELLGSEFCQLSGEDANAYDFLAEGGHGCISVTANIAPRLCADMQDAWRAGKKDEAHAIQERLMPLHGAMFSETSPAPVKYAAQCLGFGTDEVRLPMVHASANARRLMDEALNKAGITMPANRSLLQKAHV